MEEQKALSLQCRGKEGKLAKDVGVVIVKSDLYENCSVQITCPHYVKHPLKTESQGYDQKAGCCKVSGFRVCLFDRLKL